MGSEASPTSYRFDRFVLDLARGLLLADDGGECALRPKSFRLLRHFVENAGRLVGRDEVMQVVWPNVFVTDDSIAQCVKEIRRALGDGEQRVLRTLPRRGYLFSARVLRTQGHATPGSAPNAADLQVAAWSAARRPVMVVLPFHNGGDNAEFGYFIDGLTADLIAALTRFHTLHVVHDTLQGGADHRAASHEDAASAPDFRFLLSGSVRQANGCVRVTAQLADAQRGVSLWAEQFDRPKDCLFAAQAELVDRIAIALSDRVNHELLQSAKRKPPEARDAYDLCLCGREQYRQFAEAGTLAARQIFDQAIAADPDYGLAYACQAFTVQRGLTYGWGQPRGPAALELALTLAQRAVALDPTCSLCLASLGYVLILHEGRKEEALKAGQEAVAANPRDYWTRATYAEILTHAGEPEAGIREVNHTLGFHPLHPPAAQASLGRALLLAGRPEDALPELRASASRLPDYGHCRMSLVVACVETGRMDEARAALRDVRRLYPGWRPRNFDGPWFFHRALDARRFSAGFRAVGMPEADA